MIRRWDSRTQGQEHLERRTQPLRQRQGQLRQVFLVDLLARARVEDGFPWAAIDDETRPEDLNSHFWNPQSFFKDQFSGLLKGYRRNRQQSQPDHIEIVAEKLTVRSILDPIASEHSMPLSISRGHCGPTMKRKIAQRFKRSNV